jgi:type VI protein secretion system component Hcp
VRSENFLKQMMQIESICIMLIRKTLLSKQMKLAIILVTVLELVIASSSALAETDKPRSAGDPIFLNYEGIAGDVNGDGCTGIQLDSFQWGATNTPTTGASGGGGGAGKVAIHDIPITKHTDSASPNFFKALVTGNH